MNSLNYSRKSKKQSKIYIVGAGPGDADLITLKGLKILKRADCIIYDYLVNKQLLKYASKKSELINADEIRNKFSNGFTKEQDKLNSLIIEKAKEYKTVVRLKNGDACIFSRLNEEISALVKNKIDFEIVPGITAASSAASSLKVGLTKTKLAPIVSFITGHENPFNKLKSVHFETLPKQSTLVFYMAVKNIEKIAHRLIEIGWNKNTFCAILEKAGQYDEKKRIGKLKDIKNLVLGINSPTVFLVGNVLKYAVKKN